MVLNAPQLTDRQREILRHVVEEYIRSGQPVGSKHLVERAGLSISPSTVRSELAELERLGLLTHPHTSAGRVPTEHGYRLFVHGLLDRIEPRPASLELDLTEAGTEVEAVLQATTEALSHVTRLLALVSAPPIESAHRAARRGARAAAASDRCGRHHLDGRRDEARVRASASRSTRGS